MQYKLMNEYSVDWPFWGGRQQLGPCAEDDPKLPEELSTAARRWAAQFNELFDYERGWPDQAIAAAHESEGKRIFTELQRVLPEHEVVFRYWERGYFGAP